MKDILKGILLCIAYFIAFFSLSIGSWGLYNYDVPILFIPLEVLLICTFISYVSSIIIYLYIDWKYRRKKFFGRQYEGIIRKMDDMDLFKDE